MWIIDNTLIFLIVVTYNIFIHHFVSYIYRSQEFEKRQSNTITTVAVCGLIGIIASLFIKDYKNSDGNNKKNKKNKRINPICKGLKWGGGILVLTAFLANWENFGETAKLIISGGVFAGLLYISNKIG